MPTEKPATIVMTPYFRASFPFLLKPKKNLNDKMEFSVDALFKKGEDLKALEAAVEAACVLKWGTEKKKWPKEIKKPFKDQDSKDKGDGIPDGYVAGAMMLTLKSTNPPPVFDQKKAVIIDPNQIYGGVWLRAEVNAFAYDRNGNRGVSFGLNAVQKVRDDKKLGRSQSTGSFFDEVPIEEENLEEHLNG